MRPQASHLQIRYNLMDVLQLLHIILYIYIYIYRMMEKLLHNCKNHIEDDHLLLRLLVFLSSEDDIDVMLDNAPVHIVALHVADLWWDTNDGMKEVIT